KVIAVSERTKQDIIELYGTPADKIEVVYQGCDPVFTQPIEQSVLENVRQKYNLPKEFILYVGSIEERKNLLLAVKALKQTKQDIPLIAVGKRTAYTALVEKYIAENGLQDRVKLIHNVPFADLPAFYQLGKLFVYPSLYEGFGIPIIEAIHGGLPVVAATESCLEEAGGPDSIYVDPHDEKELAEAFDRILSDESLRQRMISKGKEYVKRFDPQQHAKEILAVYKSCF
ncbi:MAG: glycosyltransferase family 1 protein, partial [Bacteroidota bacterium]|nr:glycosyltransferase family 1 protein [Bacteroidota bacterium]